LDDCNKIIGAIALAVGGYYTYIYLKPGGIKDMNSLGASNEGELMGYLNGLVRGSESYDNTIYNLDEWKVYWVEIQPNLLNIIQDFYLKAVENAKVVYGR